MGSKQKKQTKTHALPLTTTALNKFLLLEFQLYYFIRNPWYDGLTKIIKDINSKFILFEDL